MDPSRPTGIRGGDLTAFSTPWYYNPWNVGAVDVHGGPSRPTPAGRATPSRGASPAPSIRPTARERLVLLEVSSEDGEDFLNFYDGGSQAVTGISGEVAWLQESYTVPAGGPHVIRWCYEKSVSGASGADRASSTTSSSDPK